MTQQPYTPEFFKEFHLPEPFEEATLLASYRRLTLFRIPSGQTWAIEVGKNLHDMWMLLATTQHYNQRIQYMSSVRAELHPTLITDGIYQLMEKYASAESELTPILMRDIVQSIAGRITNRLESADDIHFESISVGDESAEIIARNGEYALHESHSGNVEVDFLHKGLKTPMDIMIKQILQMTAQ